MSEPQAQVESLAPIAVIGMACIFPQAPNLHAFWNNILRGVDAIGEPVEEWGAKRYLQARRINTQFGGFLKDLYRFDPREFGIMPNSVDGGESDQFLALRVARDALADAGYLRPDADHTETGIILGHSAYLHRGQVTVIQNNIVLDQTIDLFKAALPGIDDQTLVELRQLLQTKLPPTNADNAPGLVPNMMTGRIANRLNLRGPNYVLDAACASSLLAVAAAIDELRTGRSRMMLAGGVNATLPADVSTSFTQLGALSARGKVRPFEAGSDGTLLGEGLGVIVLKRLGDALSDGDRVYAVVRGVGQSSDGRGTGLLAPSQDGEALAMRRAYGATGIDPATVSLVEAHGTGIPLGDKTEIASLKSVFGERTTPIGIKAIGSVKSMISHCIPAAGIASLIKMSLALCHRTLPPTLCDRVNPELGIEETPFYVNTQTGPWIAHLGEPRRAAVNAFGFGGVNAHAILEQAPPVARAPKRLTDWPAELCVLSADTVPALAAKLERLARGLARNPEWRISQVAATLARADAADSHRLAIVAPDTASLARSVSQALQKLGSGNGKSWTTRSGLAYGNRRVDGKLAFLFPGEGSQYPGMFADLALCFEAVQHWIDFWHGLYNLPIGATRTDIVYPSPEIRADQRAALERRLHDMDVGSEAVFIGGMAMFELLASLGVGADVMVGHSSGESAALCACGANPATSPADLAGCISQHYAVYDGLAKAGKIPVGALLAVGAVAPEIIDRQIAAVGGDVVVAMDNCANQVVLYGSVEGIARVQDDLASLGGICIPLPFDRGYHTPAFADVSAAFLEYYRSVKLGRPKVPLYSCDSIALFPDTPTAVRKLAAAQWSRKVRFRETIRKMHDDGVRVFVEVGPSANLTSFVNNILAGREFTALASNVRGRNGVEQLLSVLGQLHVTGRGPALDRLFASRAIDEVDLDAAAAVARPPRIDNTMPMVRLTEAERERVRQLAARGVRPEPMPAPVPSEHPGVPAETSVIPVDDGRAHVMNEYLHVMRSFLDHQRTLVERMCFGGEVHESTPIPWPSTHATDSSTPLLDEIVAHDDSHVIARSFVSLRNDRFVRHHVLSGAVSDSDPELFGLPCMPLMASIEIMAEACALLAARFDVRFIENVRAFDWVALDEGELVIEVHAEVIDREQARFASRLVTTRGVAVSAEFGFAPDRRLPGVAPLVAPKASDIDVAKLYAPGRYSMFHGPVFRTVRDIAAWDDTGIDVALSSVSLDGFFAEGHTPRLVLNPALLDAMAQVVPCWLVQHVGPEFHSFPSTIGRIDLYEACPADRPGIVMRARQRPVDPLAVQMSAPRAWQFECVDGDGRLLLRADQSVNLYFAVTPSYHAARTDPLGGWMGAPVQGAPGPCLVWEVPMMPDALCTQSGGICMQILAHALLAMSERDEWRVLAGGLRRRREWLFGRGALKEAVRRWVYDCTGHLLYPTDVLIGNDAYGAPYADGWWRETLVEAPHVSLSHAGDACIAVVAQPGHPVGIDVEEAGHIQRPELLVEAFAPEERALVEGLRDAALRQRVLRMWCAKEAAAKCLGIGLQGQPDAFRIISADDACERLIVDHESGMVEAHIACDGSRVIAVAMPATIDSEVQR